MSTIKHASTTLHVGERKHIVTNLFICVVYKQKRRNPFLRILNSSGISYQQFKLTTSFFVRNYGISAVFLFICD